jgi:hypothetical protein
MSAFFATDLGLIARGSSQEVRRALNRRSSNDRAETRKTFVTSATA